jgi:hypothetical protein
MNTLKDIVAAFLDSLTGAQQEANLYSKGLAEKYRVDPLLRFFPVPNGLAYEAEITLHFVVPQEGPASPQDPPQVGAGRPSMVAVTDLAGQVSRLALQQVAQLLERSGSSELANAVQADRVAQELARRLHPLADRWLRQAMNGGDAAEAELSAELVRRLADALGDNIPGVKDQLEEAVRAGLPQIHQALREVAERQRHVQAETAQFSSLPVTLDASSLQGIPIELVHTLRLRAKLRNYKWVLVGDGDDRHDELLVTE